MKFKNLLLLSIMVLVSFPAFGKWTKRHGVAFNKETEYKVEFIADSVYCEGMSLPDFMEYTAAKNDMTADQMAVIIKYIGPEIFKTLSQKTKKTYSPTSEAPCKISIRLDELTGKAGMKVSVELSISTEKNTYVYSFKESVSDGRWNRFDVLLQENCEELAKKINRRIKGSKYNEQ